VTKYIAYTDLGPGRESGTPVDPEDFGGEKSDDFQYLLEHGNILPVNHPSAAVAMGGAPEVETLVADRDAEIASLKEQVAKLQAEKDEANKSIDGSMKADVKADAAKPGGAGPPNVSVAAGGGGGVVAGGGASKAPASK
jgi:hypothetical protein